MDNIRRLIILIFLMLFLIAFGTSGYMVFEGWEILDALYMTVITLATVGYGEVHELSKIGRLYTIILIFLGVGFFVYVVGFVIQFMVEGRIRNVLGRRRLDKKINRLKDHYIICGYGRIGRVLCRNLRGKPLNLVIIEKNPDLIPFMDEDGVLYVSGEATDESSLLKAGIKRAKGLVAVLSTDTDNVFLVLTARQLNPDIYIMARASYKESNAKLRAAGANEVESPYDIGAINMANKILRPTVTSFLDLAFTYQRRDIQLEEISVHPSSSLAEVMLKDSGIREKFNLIIIAIKKADGSMMFNPSFKTVIKGGDTVIAVGQDYNLLKLEKILNPKRKTVK